MKLPSIYVFNLTNTDFSLAGEIEQFTSFSWSDKFVGYAEFELKAPTNKNNLELLKTDNVIWCGGETAALIEIVQFDQEDNGIFITAKGRTLECLLTNRTISSDIHFPSQPASEVIYYILGFNTTSASTAQARRFPYFSYTQDVTFGTDQAYEITPKAYKTVYDAILSLCKDYNIGCKIVFNPNNKTLVFKLVQGTNRSSSVVLSTDSEDILPGSYYKNRQSYKNVALTFGIWSAGVGYVSTFSGRTSASGFTRREVAIDASDIRSTDDSGSAVDLDVFETQLKIRGVEQLAKFKTVESYDGGTVLEGVHYTYGVDYFLGDTIKVIDTEMGVQVTGVVTEVCDMYSGAKHEQTVTVGYSQPTLYTRIKDQLL